MAALIDIQKTLKRIEGALFDEEPTQSTSGPPDTDAPRIGNVSLSPKSRPIVRLTLLPSGLGNHQTRQRGQFAARDFRMGGG